MKRQDIIEQIENNFKVKSTGSCQWTVSAEVYNSETGDWMTLRLVSHDESTKTGKFDGSLYNLLCGYADMEQLRAAAEEEGMTVEEFQDACWMDTANEDNYEPAEKYRARLVNDLYEANEERLMNEWGIEL